MATWKGPDFIDLLKARLEQRPALASVQINAAPMGVDTAAEAITFHGLDGTQEWAAIGNERKRDNFSVRCTTWINKSGKDDAIAKEARDRAAALLAEVEAELKDGFEAVAGSQITTLNLSSIALDQGFNSEGRWAQVTFEINVEVRI